MVVVLLLLLLLPPMGIPRSGGGKGRSSRGNVPHPPPPPPCVGEEGREDREEATAMEALHRAARVGVVTLTSAGEEPSGLGGSTQFTDPGTPPKVTYKVGGGGVRLLTARSK